MSSKKNWPTKRIKRDKPWLAEKKLLAAIKERSREKVSSQMDKLHRMGVHQGIAMDLGKKFLRESMGRGERR